MKTRRRALETAGMLMIGDGMLAAAAPRRHLELWSTPLARIDELVPWLTSRPQLVRALGVAGVAAGIWLARRQWSDAHRGRSLEQGEA